MGELRRWHAIEIRSVAAALRYQSTNAAFPGNAEPRCRFPEQQLLLLPPSGSRALRCRNDLSGDCVPVLGIGAAAMPASAPMQFASPMAAAPARATAHPHAVAPAQHAILDLVIAGLDLAIRLFAKRKASPSQSVDRHARSHHAPQAPAPRCARCIVVGSRTDGASDWRALHHLPHGARATDSRYRA